MLLGVYIPSIKFGSFYKWVVFVLFFLYRSILKMLWQQVNSINWTVVVDMEENGAEGSLGMSMRLEMYGLRHARHLHLQVLHADDSCQLGTMLSYGVVLVMFSLMRM